RAGARVRLFELAALRAHVARVEAHGPGLRHAYRDDPDCYEDRAAGLLASARDGTRAAVATLARWRALLTAAGARAAIAREHGFASGRRCAAPSRRCGRRASRSRAPTGALEAHDVEGLGELLDRFPELVAAQGTNGNDLLGMATATCDERLVALLLERGADVA